MLHCTQLVARRLVAPDGGGSMSTSSPSRRAAPRRSTPAYAAAKAGAISLTRTLALELAPHGIRVNAIAPDICLTEGLAAMVPPAERGRWADIVPLGRRGASPTTSPAPPCSSPRTCRATSPGITLHVDGGTHAAGGWYRDPDGGAWVLGPPRLPRGLTPGAAPH